MKVSVVAPCYNEAQVLVEFHRRVGHALREAGISDAEILLVDDGSTDGTWEIITLLHQQDRRVRGIRLSRNFGHQAALTAGLLEASGEGIFIIDADLQDPPELLHSMLELLRAGHDVVYGQRRLRHGESAFKKVSAALFYRILGQLADIHIPKDTGDFRLINRKVLNAYRALSERHRFTRGLISWLGFRQVALPYDREPRFAGETKYPFRKMLNFSIDAITGFSLKPLRLIIFFGLLSSGVALLALCYTLYAWLFSETVPGWTSLMIVVLLLSCTQIVCIGVVGEYVGRTFTEAKKRPLYFIQERSEEYASAHRHFPQQEVVILHAQNQIPRH